MVKKVATYIAIGLIVIGVGLAFIGMNMKAFDFNVLFSDTPYEEKIYDVTEDFDNINLTIGSESVEILLSDDNDTHFVCYENDSITHEVSVNGDTLKIKYINLKKVHIGIYWGVDDDRTAKLYLPKDKYNEFIINLGSGDIAFDSFSFDSINAEVGSGDIEITNCSVSGDAEFNTGSGKVIIGDFTCDNGSFKAASGDYELTNVICSGDLDLEVSSGDIEMFKCDAENMTISVGSGTITGTVLSEYSYNTKAGSGDIEVPSNGNDGTCKIDVGSGDVNIALAK